MYFDHRDVAANTKKWYKSFDESKMTVTIELYLDEEVCEELKECLSEETYKLIDKDGCVTFR